MSEETFPLDFGTSTDNWITSPTGRNLSFVCKKNTTLYTDENVKDILIPEKYVLLEITTERTGYTIQKVYGHPNVATRFRSSVEQQPAVVVPTYRAKLTLFDSTKGETGSRKYDINVTRDAWYYLGVDDSSATWCRNIAFEPLDGSKNRYLTDQIHFPSAADPIVHGYFLMEAESQRQQHKRFLHAETINLGNKYVETLRTRGDPCFATNVMFHIGGFYMARAGALHAKWLGGSEGCFAFIPQKSVFSSPEGAAKIRMETAFLGNKTWVNLTTMIEQHRDSDPRKQFFIEIEKRVPFERDEVKTVFLVAGPVDRGIFPMEAIERRVI